MPPSRLSMSNQRAQLRAALVRLGRSIRSHRRAAKMSQEELASHSRVSMKFIGETERGRANPSVATLLLIARALECDVTAFFQRTAESRYVLVSVDDLRKLEDSAAVIGAAIPQRRRTFGARRKRT